MHKDSIPYLCEWVTRYLKHKDLMKQAILEIRNEENGLFVKTKQGDRKYSVYPLLTEAETLAKESDKVPTTIVTCNCRENLEFLEKKWTVFSDCKNLDFLFVNPDSKGDKKWIIRPYIHHRIADTSALMKGLEALYETVDALTVAQIERSTFVHEEQES